MTIEHKESKDCFTFLAKTINTFPL